MLKAVLFDLDHTLIDWAQAVSWEEYQADRLARVWDYVHHHLHPLTETDATAFFAIYADRLHATWQRANVTLDAPNIATVLAETLAASGVPEHRIDLDAVLDAYDWQPPPGEIAFPDVYEVLPELHAHRIGLGIVTNASHPMTWRDRELVATNLLDWFPTCRVAAVDVGVIKPHRAIFDHALDVMGIRADEAVFVGDSLQADIVGAQGAGIRAVWRAPEPGAVPDDGITPDGTITTLHELLPLLDAWYPGWRNGHSAGPTT